MDTPPPDTPSVADASATVQTAPASRLTVPLLLIVIVLLTALFLWTNRRLTALEAALEAVPQNTLDAIAALQESGGTAQAQSPGSVGIDDDAVVGDLDTAKLVMIEFSDFNCGFCGRYHAETYPRIIEEFVESGEMVYVYRDFIGVGQQVSFDAASAAECVRAQTGDAEYMGVVRGLFASQGRKTLDRVRELAADLELDEEVFETCISDGTFQEEVISDTRTAQAAGARGTPAFFIGELLPDGSVDGLLVSGAQPFENFEQVITQRLEALN